MRRRLLSLVVAVLLAILGTFSAASSNTAATRQHIPTYSYDSHNHAPSWTDPAAERAPPSAGTADTHGAADPRSRGASTRPQPSSIWTYNTYDHLARSEHSDSSSGTTLTASGVRSAEARVAPGASVAANAGDDVVRALSATERRTLDDALRPDKLDHILDPKHNFDPLVQQFGSREAAMEQIVRSIGGPLPQAGRFEIAQSIGGQTVIIRGAVVDGIPRIGTAFTP